MSYFFSDFIRTQLVTTPTMVDNKQIKVLLMEEAPVFNVEDVRFGTVTNLASLLAFPGWRQAASQPTGTISTGTPYILGKNHYVLFPNRYAFTGVTGQVLVKAFVFILVGTYGGVVDPVLFVSTSPFPEPRVVQATDGLTTNPDIGLIAPASSNKWLFTWADKADATSTFVQAMFEGPIAISQGAPPFEVSHTQHIWLYPQRANLIANPSFEAVGMNYWSTNGTATRIAGGALGSDPPSAWSGQFVRAGTVVAESNLFPMSYQEQWTIQCSIKGTGSVKVGLVYWEEDFAETAVDWGTETFTLSSSSYLHISVCRFAPQAYQGMVRIECNGGTMVLDQVLCESGYLKDWPYFDGDTTYGVGDDYSWQTGKNYRGASYSFWYNNRREIYGFLFSREIDDATLITDEVNDELGYVYQWLPAGTFVVTHMDVLQPNDLKQPLPAKGSGVLAYRVTMPADILKVTTPW